MAIGVVSFLVRPFKGCFVVVVDASCTVWCSYFTRPHAAQKTSKQQADNHTGQAHLSDQPAISKNDMVTVDNEEKRQEKGQDKDKEKEIIYMKI